jgi:uncharacterized protein (TIGR02996 family)
MIYDEAVQRDALHRQLDLFRIAAAKLFAMRPQVRSVILAVSQYWADEANDAVHDTLVASERELPLWPHRCSESTYDDGLEGVAGELCSRCDGHLPHIEGYHDNGDAVLAFEAWCHEAGNQEAPAIENLLPCAVARKRGDEIAIELIGQIQRMQSLLRPRKRGYDDDEGYEDDDDVREAKLEVVHHPADPVWNDPRARELYAQVCEHPRDDNPRRVLADYLLERNEPLGEFIALALANGSDAKVRYEHLYDTLVPGWLAPLQRVAPAATAKLDRGLLAELDVWATERQAEAVRGHLVLRSVERIRVHAGEPILDPSMRALRRLGPIEDNWLLALLAADAPWAIDDLELAELGDLELLRDTELLPALRRLALPRFSEDDVTELVTATWWKQLDRLTLHYAGRDELAAWHARRDELGVPWLALVQEHSNPNLADAWEVAFGPDGACEITLRGFTQHATLDALRELLPAIPSPQIRLVPSEHYAPAQVDVTYLRDPRVVI